MQINEQSNKQSVKIYIRKKIMDRFYIKKENKYKYKYYNITTA